MPPSCLAAWTPRFPGCLQSVQHPGFLLSWTCLEDLQKLQRVPSFHATCSCPARWPPKAPVGKALAGASRVLSVSSRCQARRPSVPLGSPLGAGRGLRLSSEALGGRRGGQTAEQIRQGGSQAANQLRSQSSEGSQPARQPTHQGSQGSQGSQSSRGSRGSQGSEAAMAVRQPGSWAARWPCRKCNRLSRCQVVV